MTRTKANAAKIPNNGEGLVFAVFIVFAERIFMARPPGAGSDAAA
jgi:hypothetical protein